MALPTPFRRTAAPDEDSHPIARGGSPWLRRPVGAVTRLSHRVVRLRLYRTVQHYLWEDGNLLAAGMSFYAVFAVFAGLYVGFAVTGVWLSSTPEISDALITVINAAVPGLIGSGHDALVSADSLLNPTLYGVTGAVALVGLSWTAIGWMFYTRQAVRAIFQVPRDTRNFFVQKLGDLLMALGIGILLIVSAVLSILGTQFLEWFLSLFGYGPRSTLGSVAGTVVALAISVLINAVTLTMMFRVLSRIPIPWRALAVGVTIGSSVLAGLSVVSGLVLDRASGNPLLDGFALFVALLVWFNLVSRVILVSASWIAVTLADQDVSLHVPTEEERVEALRRARRLVALEDVREARRRYASARGIARVRARRELRRAIAVARAN